MTKFINLVPWGGGSDLNANTLRGNPPFKQGVFIPLPTSSMNLNVLIPFSLRLQRGLSRSFLLNQGLLPASDCELDPDACADSVLS